MQPYFIWNGVDSREMGVVVTSLPPMVYPAERAETVTIPGRPGFLTRTEGEHVYDGYLKTIGVGNYRRANAQAIAAWLRGQGELILSSEPGFVYYARVLKEVSASRVMQNVFSGSVAFMVQPGKGQHPPEADITLTSATATVWNPGDLPARPIYTLTGSGRMILTLTPATSFSQIVIDPIDTGWEDTLTGAVIDTDTMTVTTPDGAESLTGITTIYRNGHQGLWIPPHTTVGVVASMSDESGSLTQVRITPRWRWL